MTFLNKSFLFYLPYMASVNNWKMFRVLIGPQDLRLSCFKLKIWRRGGTPLYRFYWNSTFLNKLFWLVSFLFWTRAHGQSWCLWTPSESLQLTITSCQWLCTIPIVLLYNACTNAATVGNLVKLQLDTIFPRA